MRSRAPMLRGMVREGTSDDFGRATELLNLVWPHRVGSERGLRHAAAAEPANAHRRYWAAEVDGRLVGWATAAIEYQSSERPGFLLVSVAQERRRRGPRICAPRALRGPPGRSRCRDCSVVQHSRGAVPELCHRTWLPPHQHDADLRRRPAHDRAWECPAWRRSTPALCARATNGLRGGRRGDGRRAR